MYTAIAYGVFANHIILQSFRHCTSHGCLMEKKANKVIKKSMLKQEEAQRSKIMKYISPWVQFSGSSSNKHQTDFTPTSLMGFCKLHHFAELLALHNMVTSCGSLWNSCKLQHFAELLALHTTWLLDERESKQRVMKQEMAQTKRKLWADKWWRNQCSNKRKRAHKLKEAMVKQEEAQPRGKDAKTTSACRWYHFA